MVTPNLTITTPWWSFLYSLYQRLGSNSQVQTGNLQNDITALQSQIETLTTDVANAEAEAKAATAAASQGLTFENQGEVLANGIILSALPGLLFSQGEGTILIGPTDQTPMPLQAQTLSTSPFTFTATEPGAIAISGGLVQTITLSRQGVTIPISP